jgi:hypothetical protein
MIKRSLKNPIIYPELDKSIGDNINGPSLIRVPEWVKEPLGKYYLYFAHHGGKFIRMAYADNIEGPYKVYTPGVMQLKDTPFDRHIASPDVHIDKKNKKIWMHYHGALATRENPLPFSQLTCYAGSDDGLDFTSNQLYLAESYLRTFYWRGWYYGLAGGPGRIIYRGKDPARQFEMGPVLEIEGEPFTDYTDKKDIDALGNYRVRHVGLHLQGDTLTVYYSNVGDEPERIKCTRVDISKDWTEWRGSRFEEVLRPGKEYEGVKEPIERSVGGWAPEAVHQLRDPYVFEEDGKAYLLYAVAGEKGIGMGEIKG